MFRIQKLKINIEYIFLIIFSALFLYLGCGFLFDNTVQHPYPYAYMAGDSFLHQTNAEGIKDLGSNLWQPFWYSGVIDTPTIGYNPPILSHLSVLLSNLSGLEVYDTMYFLVFISALFSVLILYITIRQFNKNIAILSLPVTLFIFTTKFYSGFTWGQWDLYTGVMFLAGVVFILNNLELKNSYIVLAFFISAAFLAHVVEGIWAAFFVGFYLLYTLLTKTFTLNTLKKMIYAALISIILTLNYLLIFLKMWLPGRQNILFTVKSISEFGKAYPIPFLTDLSIIILLIIFAGLIISAFYIKKEKNASILFALFMIVMGYTYLIGFDKAIQLRFNWPIYISVLFGIAMFQLLKLFIKDFKTIYAVIISLLLILALPYLFYNKVQSPGMVNPYLWEQLTFIQQKTPENSHIYYFYGDPYSQHSLMFNTKRYTWVVDTNEYIQALQNQTVKRYITSRLIGGTPSTGFTRPSFFTFELNQDLRNLSFSPYSKDHDICEFDYYVFDVMSYQQALAQYNIYVMQQMLQKNTTQIVFQNQLSVILKNDHPGEECV